MITKCQIYHLLFPPKGSFQKQTVFDFDIFLDIFASYKIFPSSVINCLLRDQKNLKFWSRFGLDQRKWIKLTIDCRSPEIIWNDLCITLTRFWNVFLSACLSINLFNHTVGAISSKVDLCKWPIYWFCLEYFRNNTLRRGWMILFPFA